MNAWYVPVNAHPAAVRFRAVGETRPVQPTEAKCLLPVYRWPEPAEINPPRKTKLVFENRFYVDLGDAHHYTALGFPA